MLQLTDRVGIVSMSSERAWFDKPVQVRIEKVSVTHRVSNAVQAADFLLNKWPKTGPQHRAARKAVLNAMQSHTDAKARLKAQKEFEAAAREAGVLFE